MQTLAAPWCTSELTVYFGKPFLWRVRMNVSLLNLCDLPKPLQLGSGSNKQLCSACKSYSDKETMDFLKKTYGDVILSGDHANFSICIGFWLNACQRSPSSGARHWLAQGCPGDRDTDGDVMFLSPDRTTWIFPKAWTAQRAAAAAVEGEPRPQHLRVSLAQVVFGSPCINGINHHFGFCSWDAARGSKLRFGGKH